MFIMPYKYYRSCPLCHLCVKDISSHLRFTHKLSPIERKPYLNNAIISSSLLASPVSQRQDYDLAPAKHGSTSGGRVVKKSKEADHVYLVDNLAILRRFISMTRERKKWYLKKIAPESFIKFLREAFNMIEIGRIKCLDKLDKFYGDKVLNKDISHERARLLMAGGNVIGFIECMVVEVMLFLSDKLG